MEWVLIVEEVTASELSCEKLRKNEEIYSIVMRQTEQLVYD